MMAGKGIYARPNERYDLSSSSTLSQTILKISVRTSFSILEDAPRSGAQTVGQGDGAAGGDGLLLPADCIPRSAISRPLSSKTNSDKLRNVEANQPMPRVTELVVSQPKQALQSGAF